MKKNTFILIDFRKEFLSPIEYSITKCFKIVSVTNSIGWIVGDFLTEMEVNTLNCNQDITIKIIDRPKLRLG